MNISLIQPPVRDFYFTPMRSFPLGLCSLAAVLIKEGHSVEILDCLQGGRQSRSVNDDTAFDYLKKYYPPNHHSPFGLYKKFKHFGLSFEEIEARISQRSVEVFGVSCLFSAYADEALAIAALIKKHHPQSIVVLGGPHAQEYAEKILSQHSFVDFIIHGEGEATFPELLRFLREPEQVKGLSFRANGLVRQTPRREPQQDLSAWPWPQRDLLDLNLYVIGGQRYTPVLTSRGCPLGCAFCSNPSFMGERFRVRNVDDVCEEIFDCYDRHGVRIFDLEDDNFTCLPRRAEEILTRLIAQRGDRHFEITAMNGLYYETLDETLIALLAEAGMRRLNLSLVTTSRASAANVKRRVDHDSFEKVIQRARQKGMDVLVSFILGMPGETVEDMLNTLFYLSDKSVLLGPSCYYHVPGADLFTQMEAEGSVSRSDYRYFRSSAVFYESPAFSRKDVLTVFRLTRMINFMKSLTPDRILPFRVDVWYEILAKEDKFLSSDRKDGRIKSRKPLTPEEIGIILIKKFLDEGKVFGLVRSKEGYQAVPEEASAEAVKLFLTHLK